MLTVNKYRVRLINPELISAVEKVQHPVKGWHIDISANSMQSAWRKFNVQKKAPIWHFGMDNGTGRAEDYDISLVR